MYADNMTQAHEQGGGVIFVLGHRHPDTDSIVCAIAYAHLKQKMGLNAVACRCGDISPDTKHILERFNQPEPLFIQDARSQMDETEMDEANLIGPNAIIKDVIETFSENKKIFTVVDERRRLLGVVTNSSIGDLLWGDTAKAIHLLSETPIESIAQAVDGKILYAPAESRQNGKVSIAAISANRLKFYDLQDRIVILGNDTNAQIEAIEKGAAILILVWTKQIAPMVLEAAKAHKCAVILSGHGAMNTSHYLYYSIPVHKIMTTDLVVFNEAEFVDDVREKMIHSRYRFYPIVDSENRVMGLSSRYRVLSSAKRRFILVDHNERKQAVPNIDKAEILEIVDHHRLGDLTSDMPIAFRNEPVGATATIISKIFLERGIQPDKDIAGLLLSAIITDTLNFRSPTTSPDDHKMANHWAEYTGLEIEELAKDIFQAGAQRTLEDLQALIHGDMKEFDIAGGKVIISQHTMYRLNAMESIKEQIQEELEKAVQQHPVDLWVMIFTSARDNGSIFFAAGPKAAAIANIFPNLPGEEHSFQKGVVSRKNQVVPKLALHFRGDIK